MQEGHSHPASHCCKRQSLGHFNLLQQEKLCPEKEGAVFCVPASLVRRWMSTRAEGTATSHSKKAKKAQLLLRLLQPCQWGLCSDPQPELQQHRRARLNDALQPQPSSRAKLLTFSTSKCTKGYNTVSNGSLHSSEMDPEAITYGY